MKIRNLNILFATLWSAGAWAQPANDDFVNTIEIIGVSGQALGSNVGATQEAGEPTSFGDNSVWWKWTAPFTSRVTFDTVGSNFDTLLQSFTGAAVGSLVLVGFNDDGGPGLLSRLPFNATAGTQYMIAVRGYANFSIGSITLNWNQVAPPTVEIAVFSGGAPLADGGGPIDFGSRPQGFPAPAQTLRVQNIGGINLTTANLVLPAPFLVTEELDALIAPGAFDDFTIELPTATMGMFQGPAQFDNNDVDENPFNFSVTGEILPPAPDIDANPIAIGFGAKPIDDGPTSPTVVVTISNTGMGPLNISSVSLTCADAGQFGISADTAETSLAPGATRTVQVVFDPMSPGAKSAIRGVPWLEPFTPAEYGVSPVFAVGGP